MVANLTSEEKEILRQFENGRLLQETLNTPGWQLVLDVMEKVVVQSEFQLKNYNGTDKEALVALHRRARDHQEFFDLIQQTIAVQISNAKQTPNLINQRSPEENESY